MGRSKKAQRHKTKRRTRTANESETSHSSDNTSESDIDGTRLPKARNQSTDDIQAAGVSTQTFRGGNKGKRGRHRSTGDIHAASFSPQTVKAGKKDKKGRYKSTGDIQAASISPKTFQGGKKDKKGKHRSTDDIQAESISPQTLKGGKKDKKGRYRSTGDIEAASISAQTFQGRKKDKGRHRSTGNIDAANISPQTFQGEKKGRHRSTGEIEAASFFPQTVQGGNKDKKDGHRSTGDIEAASISPQTFQGGKKDKNGRHGSTGDIEADASIFFPQAVQGGNEDRKGRYRSADDIQAEGFPSQTMQERDKYRNVSLKPTGDIQAASHSPQESMTTEKGGKGNSIRSTFNSRTVEQISDSVDSDLDDEQLEKIIDEVGDALKEYKEFHGHKQSKDVPSRQYKYMLDSLAEHQSDLNEFFKSQDPKFGRHLGRCINMMQELHILDSSAKNTVTTEVKSETHEEITPLKKLNEDQTIAITTAGIDDDSDDSLINLEMDEEKEKSDDTDKFSEDIQKATHFPLELVEAKKDEKDNKCFDNILTSGSSPQNVESKKESIKINVSNKNVKLMNLLDKIKGNDGTAKDSEMKPLKKMAKNVSPEKNKCKKLFQESQQDLKECSTARSSKLDHKMKRRRAIDSVFKILSEYRDAVLKEKETAATILDAMVDEETGLSKELPDQANDIIKEVETVEDEKIGKKCMNDGDSSADYIQPTENFPQNTTEGKKGGKKGKEHSDGSNEDIKVFHSDQQLQKPMPVIEESIREEKDEVKDSNNMTKSIIPENTETRESGDAFLRDLVEFLNFQNSKLDEQVVEYKGQVTEWKYTKKQRDLLPPDQETVSAIEVV
ncbi:hypothetical protein HNY73_007270 [Argiope bruennichi]|uniref:Uncharacterized protein n=1 Tax=Argiope bruennichi TaxID=94029 RepID=A0A8T0FIH6_ARGBR|nr:hypothetical protein HNY73_007270 [Argiope bruennichi]